ncbi:MAG: copper chaperone PCu(A)C [Rickettsiales bacterium]|nr:MAG: copper chaperone PCu(A)C [Rickettsiales bacterium]
MKKNIISLISATILCFVSINTNAENMQTPAAKLDHNKKQDITEHHEQNTLIISDAWARKSISPNNNSAAYMKIQNPTDQQITIIGASATKVANNVELHESFVDERGISRMTTINSIVVPANSTIELAPNGIHIMLFDLKREFKEKDKFEITVKIQEKDPIIVDAIVESR